MSRTTVVYLSGFGRSGSTLVERLLGAAPGWVNVGELVDLARSVAPADERCGCGQPFSACPFWTRVGDVAFGGWQPDVLERLTGWHRTSARQRHLPSLLAVLRGREPSESLSRLRATYASIYAAVATVAAARVVVDASKGPALGAALAGCPDIDLRVLNVVRDPRAVAWSWGRHVERPHAVAGTDQMWRIPAHRSAAQWTALQLEVEAVRRAGVPVVRLRYEDLVLDPAPALARAGTALGLDLASSDLPIVEAGSVALHPSHGLSGNPARFRSGPVPLSRDDQWLTAMPARSQAVVTALTLPLVTRYGYPLRPRHPEAARQAARHATWSST